MDKGTKLSELEEGYITALKRVGNLRENFLRPQDAVKPLSAIIWKVQLNMEQKTDLLARKITTTIQENFSSTSKILKS